MKKQPDQNKPPVKEQEDLRASLKLSTGKDSSALPKKVRCYNCSKIGHISIDCKLPKKEKGTCFKCGEKGHMASECKNKSKTDSDQIACVDSISEDNSFKKLVTLTGNDPSGNFKISVEALLDTVR